MGHLTLRLDDELRAKLEAAAAADRRPVTALARIVLADWIEKRAAGEQRAT
jgi:predicted transcriptional regulator